MTSKRSMLVALSMVLSALAALWVAMAFGGPAVPEGTVRAAYDGPAPVALGQNPAAAPNATPSLGFAGKWITEDGEMLLEVVGDRVLGLVAAEPPATVLGRVSGRRLEMQYVIEGEPAFRAEVLLAEDARSFSGRWRVEDGSREPLGEQDPELRGTRLDTQGFAGDWSSSFGRMRLEVNGTKVTGTYELGGASTIDGTVDGRLLRFRYTEPGGVSGLGEFRLAEDGASFMGRWRQDGGRAGPLDEADDFWLGLRRAPGATADVGTWLVVLEPHWEPSISHSEFSFGEMLREYYRRIPNLRVRHRRIHDRADFVRVGKEISSIEGDVILYVASHGTEAGAVLADGPIDATLLAGLLARVKNVRLVHFGSCLVAGGQVPEDVLRSLPPDRRVPISGFTRTADWGGSAIVDFAYLDNLLERRLEPKAAVAATRRNVLFASDAAPGPVPPMDLRILMPEDVATEPVPRPARSP